MKFIFFGLGMALLGLIVAETDIARTAALVSTAGWSFLTVLIVYLVAFAIDTVAWLLTASGIPLNATWLYRFFQLRLVGEAFNTVTPTASMGGEAMKAVMLKSHYGVNYHDGTASLILAKTVIVMTLVAFLGVGFALILGSPKLDASYKTVSGVGLAAFAVGIGLFFLVQRYKITSAAGSYLARSRWLAKLNDGLHHLHAVEDRLIHFYTRRPGRLIAVSILSFFSWALGIAEVWVVMRAIGHPISFADAWIIEAVAQLVRSATFFIPANIGVQEGAFLVVGAAITGQPTFGLTIAIARRLREIVWSVWGLAVYSLLKPRPGAPQT